MSEYFIKYQPYSMSYTKYKIVKLSKGYAIKIKPTWKRGRIFNSSTLGKFHKTEEQALTVLHHLADKYKTQYYIEWKEQAEKEFSRYNCILYDKWKRRTAHKEGINVQLVEGRYLEYRKMRGFEKPIDE